MSTEYESIPMEEIPLVDGKIDEYIKTDRLIYFKLLRTIISVCSQKEINFEELVLLKNKYQILQSIEIRNVLDDKNFKDVNVKEENQKQFKEKLRTTLLDEFYKKCKEDPIDKSDLCFFAAATCQKEELYEIITSCPEILEETRCCDSILVFTLKYGNMESIEFFRCLDLLIQSNIDINKPDFNGKTAIEYVVTECSNNEDKFLKINLKDVLTMLIQKGVFLEFLEEETINSIQEITNSTKLQQKHIQDQHKNRLFFWIGREKPTQFLQLEYINQFVNCDNGELTLLQFACEKSEKMHSVVEFLLKNGADPNRITKLCHRHPLEIAARQNNDESFIEILLNQRLEISEEMFNRFADKWRSKSIQQNYFEMFLESEKLDPTFTCKLTGNTSLHYAKRFCNNEVIQRMLKHKNLLHVFNQTDTSILNMISAGDLQPHFDVRLVLDESKNFNSPDFKIKFDFSCLLLNKSDEVEIISKISKAENLQQFLTHPLVHTFIMLKWSQVQLYYRLLLMLQVYLFANLSLALYFLSNYPSCTNLLYFVFFGLNFIIKLPCIVWLHFSGTCRFPNYYAIAELVLVLILVLGFFMVGYQVCAFIEMCILLLLTISFHPKLARWCTIFTKLFKMFITLLASFSLIVIAFAFLFHQIFQKENDESFKTIWNSISTTYFLLTGEYKTRMKNKFVFSATSGYLMALIVVLLILLYLFIFWKDTIVRNVATDGKDAEINKLKHIITFLSVVEGIFSKWTPRILNPSLFPEGDNPCVDFYINRKCQLKNGKYFPQNVDQECTENIKQFCIKQI